LSSSLISDGEENGTVEKKRKSPGKRIKERKAGEGNLNK